MNVFQSLSSLLLLISAIICESEDTLPNPLSDAFIELINKKQSTWTAGRNFAEDTSMDYIKLLAGVTKSNESNENKLEKKTDRSRLKQILPENFDPRAKWVTCPSLNEIRDQGACSSCWANSIAASVTDRVCIHSNGTNYFHFSAQDLLSCSGCTSNCREGGDMQCAWQFWTKNGIVSGGPYNSSEGCKPYELKPCEHSLHRNKRPLCILGKYKLKCDEHCQQGYEFLYKEDKHYGKKAFTLEGEDNIKEELYNNGPLVAVFDVYEDLLVYKHGIYRHHIGKELGYHASKLMGWGVENGTKYWLLANSWNTDFGENGFFRIIRGENNCGIEESITGGYVL